MNIVEHWEKHAEKHKPDYFKDPIGLQNVCIPTEPLWLNKYHDTIQKRVFMKLLWELDPVKYNFIEIGCGTGRWSRRLYDQGWSGIGLDLQESVIESNKRRIPGVVFLFGDFINFNLPEKCALVLSVTVLQHIPPESISKALTWIKNHLAYDGRLIMLENISFKSETVFSYSIREWENLLGIHGLRVEKVVPYDHSYFLKFSTNYLGSFFKRQAVFIDSLLDPLYKALDFAGANHAGFLVRKY